MDRGPRTTLFTTTADWSKIPNHGFWDAGWVLSRSGRLTLLAQAVVFGRMPDYGRRASRLGFAWHADAQLADGVDGPVSARAWMVTLPYWLLVLLGLPMPLLWRRVTRRRRDTAVS